MRASGTLMKVISQDIPEDIWSNVSPVVFENLMHWYVMSVDAKVVLIQEAHPLDVKVLSILRRASEIDSQKGCKETFAKAKVFLRCLIRLLSSCGSKHKNYMAQHELIVEKAMQELVDDIGDVVITFKDEFFDDCVNIIRCFLAIMNSNSVIPKYALQSVGDCWLRMPDLPLSLVFIKTLLTEAAKIVNTASMVSDLLEDCLVAFFCDRSDGGLVTTSNVKWNQVLPFLILPKDKEQRQKCLDHAVQTGHCLLLYASLQQARSDCLSIQDEHSRLVSTLLDWFRHITLSETNEPKVPLLFKEMVLLCHRQIRCGASEAVVVKALLDFTDALAPLHEAGNRDWGILGLFSSRYRPPARIKVLGLSLVLYIQGCILPGPRLKRNGTISTESPVDAEKLKGLERELESLRTKQAFYGLADCIEWVLKVTREDNNSIEHLEEFLTYLLCQMYSDSWYQ